MTPGLRASAAALVAGVATAVLVGCGIDTKNPGAANTSTAAVGNQTTTGSSPTPKPSVKLPKPPKGVVRVEGPRQGSLTPIVISKGVPGVSFSFANVGESQGFADLCNGRIDVLDTSRLITDKELRVCTRNGLQLTDNPIQVASDAVVIATRNESDVGGDCLRLSTVNEIFRAGSPITSWSQVGFFDIPLRTTGREDSSPTFQSFAQLALGVQRNASLADVRGDYLVHTTDGGVRDEVTNQARRRAILKRYATRLQTLQVDRQVAFNAFVQAAIRRAKNRMLAIFDSENRQRAATKVTLTAEQKLLIQRDNLRRIIAAQNAAQARAIRDFRYPQLTFLQQRIRRLLRNQTFLGTIGYFRFSYYELFENQLRPMEIWDPATSRAILSNAKNVDVTPQNPRRSQPTTTTVPVNGTARVNPSTTPWCVFPSQTTITNGSYPLARRLFLYVSKAYLKRAEVKTFLRTYLTNAQSLATQNRLVPIPDTVLSDDQNLVEGTQNPANETPSGTSTTQTTQTTQTTPTTPPADEVPGVASGATSTTP